MSAETVSIVVCGAAGALLAIVSFLVGERTERQRCADICEAEKVAFDETGAESDAAYNQACDDIASAIRSGK